MFTVTARLAAAYHNMYCPHSDARMHMSRSQHDKGFCVASASDHKGSWLCHPYGKCGPWPGLPSARKLPYPLGAFAKHGFSAAAEERIPDDLWVQCDFPQCLKWRKMPGGTDPSSLPDNWFCYNHPNPAVAALSHRAPEEEYKVPAEAEVGSLPAAATLHCICISSLCYICTVVCLLCH